jgi:hypothetical protein
MKIETKSVWVSDQKMYILYCTVAGLISVWAISGLLVLVDYISGTPTGTFFAVIGISLGINDPAVAQYVGFGLHLLTGTVAGNVYGQVATFWRKMAPEDYKHGIMTGLVAGFVLWAVLFVPLATLGIQQKLDSYAISAPNQYIYDIANHFQGMYGLIIGGSLAFHFSYGALLGFLAGRMTERRVFLNRGNSVSIQQGDRI